MLKLSANRSEIAKALNGNIVAWHKLSNERLILQLHLCSLLRQPTLANISNISSAPEDYSC